MSNVEKAVGSQSTPLQRAHALSARASLLLRPSQPSKQAFGQALDTYRQAADLFEASAEGVRDDEGAKGTLKMLTVQHRKLARDLERRMNSTPKESPPSGRASLHPRGVYQSPSDGNQAALMTDSIRQVSKHVSSQTSEAGVPPFAYRPPHSVSVGHPTNVPPKIQGDSTSALHSSSSSSEAPEESYIHFGTTPDTLDPFSRFWGMLDNMLEDVSNPVVFTSAPLDGPSTLPRVVGEDRKPPGLGKGKAKTGEADIEIGPSSTESFYVVPRGKLRGNDDSDILDASLTRSPLSKTPEELALENSSLRASLDAIASHLHAVKQENHQLKAQLEERDKRLATALSGVRREAARAKQGQEVWKSQLLAGSTISTRGVSRLESNPGSGSAYVGKDALVAETTALKKRLKELEEEVQTSKEESEKQKHHIAKYRDRFDKLKANARAKKEAKMVAAEGTTSQNPTAGGAV